MAIQEKYIVHYRPESRTRQKGTIIIRKSNDPMLKCEEQIGSIYDQACRLLNTVKVWKENSFDDDLIDCFSEKYLLFVQANTKNRRYKYASKDMMNSLLHSD